MAFVSVPYSFVNGTTADATQMNSNFTALINGLSDGTKDVTISKLVATSGTIGTVSATTVLATLVSAPTVNVTVLNAGTVSATTLIATTVTAPTINAGVMNATTVSATTVLATLVSAPTINGTNVNVTTVSAATFQGTLVSAATMNGTKVNAGDLYVSGAVGVGKSVPSANLDVVGSAYIGYGVASGGRFDIAPQADGTVKLIVNSYSGTPRIDFVQSDGATKIMSIENNGKISVGTTAAGAKLDVVGTCNATTLLANSCTIGVINGTTVSATTFLGTLVSASTVIGYNLISSYIATSYLVKSTDGLLSNSYLFQGSSGVHLNAGDKEAYFCLNNNGLDKVWLTKAAGTHDFEVVVSSGGTAVCVKQSNGYVGINTNSPTSRLHVDGLDAYSSNASAIAGSLTTGAFYRSGDAVCVVH